MEIEPTPATGAINIEQAIGLLGATPAPEPEAAPEPTPEATAETAEAPEPESEAEPTAEDAPEAEEPTGDAEPETEEAAEPPIPAPQSWAAADKEHFATLDRKSQEIILARETDRDKATQRSVQDAADARKQAETARAEAQSVTNIKAVLDQIIPVAIETFKSKWSDWTPASQAEMAKTDPAGFVARKAEYDAEVAEMGRLQAVNQQTQQVAFQHFVQTEQAKLPQLAPDLADPKEGPARRSALASFLVEAGVPSDQIKLLDANTLGLAYDAMRYRQDRAKAATAARPTRPAPAPAAPAVRPAAAQPAPSRQRSADAALERLNKTGSTDDAVAALRALRQRRG